MLRESTFNEHFITTGDESCFYLRQVGQQQANASWVGKGESPRTVVRRDRF